MVFKYHKKKRNIKLPNFLSSKCPFKNLKNLISMFSNSFKKYFLFRVTSDTDSLLVHLTIFISTASDIIYGRILISLAFVYTPLTRTRPQKLRTGQALRCLAMASSNSEWAVSQWMACTPKFSWSFALCSITL